MSPVWASETKMASNALGAKYSPRAIMPWKKAGYRSVLVASHGFEVERQPWREEHPQHGTEARDGNLQPGLGGGLLQPGTKTRGGVFQLLVRRLCEFTESGDARSHGDWISGECARLIYGAHRGEPVHNVGPAAHRADRHPTADYLAQARQVGPYADDILNAELRHAEAGDYFVEYQDSPGVFRQFPQRVQKPRHRRHQSHISGPGFHYDRRDLFAGLLKNFRHRLDGIERRHDGVGGCRSGHARRCGYAHGEGSASGGHEKMVAVPVVVAGEFQDFVPPGKGAREAQGGHRRLRSGTDEANPFDRLELSPDDLGQLHLAETGRPERTRPGGGVRYGAHHIGIRVAEYHRPPASDVVAISPSLGIEQVRPERRGDEYWRSTDGFPRPHRAVDPSDEVTARSFVQFLGVDKCLHKCHLIPKEPSYKRRDDVLYICPETFYQLFLNFY